MKFSPFLLAILVLSVLAIAIVETTGWRWLVIGYFVFSMLLVYGQYLYEKGKKEQRKLLKEVSGWQ